MRHEEILQKATAIVILKQAAMERDINQLDVLKQFGHNATGRLFQDEGADNINHLDVLKQFGKNVASPLKYLAGTKGNLNTINADAAGAGEKVRGQLGAAYEENAPFQDVDIGDIGRILGGGFKGGLGGILPGAGGGAAAGGIINLIAALKKGRVPKDMGLLKALLTAPVRGAKQTAQFASPRNFLKGTGIGAVVGSGMGTGGGILDELNKSDEV